MNNLFKKQEIQFIAWFSGIFLVTIVILSSTGFTPTEFQVNTDDPTIFSTMKQTFYSFFTSDNNSDTAAVATTSNNQPNQVVPQIAAEDPIRIVIPTIEVDSVIRDPSSTDTTLLDSELQHGVVHYPGSGMPGVGNMFLFGHSTGFSIVQNRAYKVFNNLKNLVPGDTIEIYSSDHIYTYVVRVVTEVDKNNTWVKFDIDKNLLTLSTCDSFGKKTDRYVVEAEYTNVREVK